MSRHEAEPCYPNWLADEFAKHSPRLVLEVLQEEGLYRHLRVSGYERFEIVTWPGALVITGGMGTYVFRRLEDMFPFFRRGKELPPINPDYWSSKLAASDYCYGDGDGVEVLSEKKCRDLISWIARGMRRNSVDNDDIQHFIERARDHFDSVSAFRQALHDTHDVDHEVVAETDVSRYTYKFLWCCHAIVWAIDAYDKLKQEK